MHLECFFLSAVTVRICMLVSSRTNLHTCTLPLAGSRSPLVKYARGSHIGFSSTSQTRSCALRMPRYVTFTEPVAQLLQFAFLFTRIAICVFIYKNCNTRFICNYMGIFTSHEKPSLIPTFCKSRTSTAVGKWVAAFEERRRTTFCVTKFIYNKQQTVF